MHMFFLQQNPPPYKIIEVFFFLNKHNLILDAVTLRIIFTDPFIKLQYCYNGFRDLERRKTKQQFASETNLRQVGNYNAAWYHVVIAPLGQKILRS